MSSLRRDIESAINLNSAENGSGTPDYILAGFLLNCLASFDMAVRDRDEWHGFVNPFASERATAPRRQQPAPSEATEKESGDE